MKLIKPSYEFLEQGFGEQDIYKQIEKVGRTCYKSEDKITNESAKPFVDRMIASKHYAMLEHGTVYLFCSTEEYVDSNGDVQYYNPLEKYQNNKYSALADSDEGMYVTTNLRVLVENEWLDDLKYLCEPTEYHERRMTVKFICDRGVSHEFVRHRVFSFAQESTRYCNYSKDKFGNEITYILPCWMDDSQVGHHDTCNVINQACNFLPIECNPGEYEEILFMDIMAKAEFNYNELIRQGWKPQQARAILPNALKTELVMTGFISDWKHFFDLRAYGVTGKPHPQASELAIPLLKEFIEKGYLHGNERTD